MSDSEITIYVVLAGIVFFWGGGLLVRDIVRLRKQRKPAPLTKLVIWIVLPAALGVVALSAMMSPTGGGPVISTLRSIALYYGICGMLFAILKLAKEDRT